MAERAGQAQRAIVSHLLSFLPILLLVALGTCFRPVRQLSLVHGHKDAPFSRSTRLHVNHNDKYPDHGSYWPYGVHVGCRCCNPCSGEFHTDSFTFIEIDSCFCYKSGNAPPAAVIAQDNQAHLQQPALGASAILGKHYHKYLDQASVLHHITYERTPENHLRMTHEDALGNKLTSILTPGSAMENAVIDVDGTLHTTRHAMIDNQLHGEFHEELVDGTKRSKKFLGSRIVENSETVRNEADRTLHTTDTSPDSTITTQKKYFWSSNDAPDVTVTHMQPKMAGPQHYYSSVKDHHNPDPLQATQDWHGPTAEVQANQAAEELRAQRDPTYHPPALQ